MLEIKPALTPEEWAEGEMSTGSKFHYEGDVLWLEDPQGELWRIPNTKAVAALCLHGRLTWAMVDALRAEIHDLDAQINPLEVLGGPELTDARSIALTRRRALKPLLDLLESLLPPREGS